jgi:hypothetical protein
MAGLDVKVTTIGGVEIASTLSRADSALRAELVAEYEEIGKDIVIGARNRVPHRTGYTMSRIQYRFGRETKRGFNAKDTTGPLILHVRPFGQASHLIERGVNATFEVPAHFRKVTRTNVKIWTRKGQRTIASLSGRAYVRAYRRTLRFGPQPFFMPAVQDVAPTIGPRLQAAVARAAAAAQGGR